MQTMVINIELGGSFEHTLKDSFFDTRGMGQRTIDRVSEVLFDDIRQQFYIKWLQGPAAGHTEADSHGNVMTFDTYENAVAHEINRLNEWRSQGLRLTA